MHAGNDTRPQLALDDLGRRYARTWAVRHLHLTVAGPQGVALTGANGSGKTTVLRMLAQLLRPSEGEIAINGELIRGGHSSARTRAATGYAGHTAIGAPMLSVHDNLVLAHRLHGVDAEVANERARELEAQWALYDVAEAALGTLSRGWTQRYSLARSLVATPQLLLLDEPTLALDRAGRTVLDAALERLCATTIVVAASHEREWLAQWTSTEVAL